MRRMSESPHSPPEGTVVVVGVGLIGGSLGAALRHFKAAGTVIGVGRDSHRLELARQAGLIDQASTDLASAARSADVIVFCTPVDRVAEGVRLASQFGRPETLLTDAGSVKQPICDALQDVANFVGSHPIAGSHRQGFEAARAQLFEGRLCVLTPIPDAPSQKVSRLKRLWESVGMRTVVMTAAEHDRSLAMTSHLPHVVAAALAGTLSDENRILTGSGFRDTTRIAGGDPELWTGILLQNGPRVIDGIETIQRQLNEFRKSLAAKDPASVKHWLTEGQKRRQAISDD